MWDKPFEVALGNANYQAMGESLYVVVWLKNAESWIRKVLKPSRNPFQHIDSGQRHGIVTCVDGKKKTGGKKNWGS